MNTPHNPRDPLDRLFQAARSAPSSVEIPQLSSARIHRVLAAWRQQRSGGDFATLVRLWRWGVASAFGVSLAVLTATWVANPTLDLESDPHLATEQVITLAVHSAWLP